MRHKGHVLLLLVRGADSPRWGRRRTVRNNQHMLHYMTLHFGESEGERHTELERERESERETPPTPFPFHQAPSPPHGRHPHPGGMAQIPILSDICTSLIIAQADFFIPFLFEKKIILFFLDSPNTEQHWTL